MIPCGIFAEDLMTTVIRYGLYITTAYQLVCIIACVILTDDQSESHPNEKDTDNDECSSEQSSPGDRAAMPRARRHDKKKRQ